jgi:hypothetical protein
VLDAAFQINGRTRRRISMLLLVRHAFLVHDVSQRARVERVRRARWPQQR